MITDKEKQEFKEKIAVQYDKMRRKKLQKPKPRPSKPKQSLVIHRHKKKKSFFKWLWDKLG